MRTLALLLATLLAALTLAPTTRAANQNETRLDTTLTPSLFAPTRAIGDATHVVRRFRSEFAVNVEDLDPGLYDVHVAGTFRGQLAVAAVPGGAEGSLRFSSRPTQGALNLNFDPRGKSIEIRTGTTVFLAGTLTTTPNPEGPDEDAEFVDYADTINAAAPGLGPRPRGTLKIRSSRKKATASFELQRLTNTVHTITANDVPIADFTPLAGGIARVRLCTNPKKNDLPLDFDPADTTFRVMRGPTVILEFVSRPGTIGGGTDPIGQVRAAFTNTNPGSDAFGSATFRAANSRFDFSVEIGDLEPGPYALRVAGSTHGTIHVSISSDLTRGIIDFSTLRDSRATLPLTFDPRGQTVQIVRDDTIFLSMTFPK